MVSVALQGRTDLSVRLGEMDSILVASDFNGSLVTACALGRATLVAPCGRDFVDEVFYLGHSPDSRWGKGNGCGVETLLVPHPYFLSPICLSSIPGVRLRLTMTLSSLADVRVTSLRQAGLFRFPRLER